ncbi:MAG: UvrB/UvrC motif-containing protein [Thermoanaerobacteraceae bacterium]|nr:UvrB/UvrC motif-containing protein [Thermoanaerobacteraceae bacterium]
MLCERCGKNPATVHYTQIVNGVKSELHLCSECAREIGASIGDSFHGMMHGFTPMFFNNNFFTEPFGLGNFLSGFMDWGMTPELDEQDLKCDYCGMLYSQFKKTGFLGCPKCYATFRDRLNPLVKRIHGSNNHVGKVPRRKGGNLRLKKEIEDLKAQLDAAIKREEFEKAAELRDRIKDLEKKLNG